MEVRKKFSELSQKVNEQPEIKKLKEDMEKAGARKLSAVISVIGPHEAEAEHLRKAVEDLGYDCSITVSYTNHSNMPHAGPDFYDIGYIVRND